MYNKFKKIIHKYAIVSLSMLAFYCVKSAHADCGNPNLGTWTCNADSIQLTSYWSQLKVNGLMDISAGNAGAFAWSPMLSLLPSVADNYVVSGQVVISEFPNFSEQQYHCSDYNNQHGFDLQVVDTNNNVISQTISTTVYAAENSGMCEMDASAAIVFNISKYQNTNGIRIRAINLNPMMRQFDPILNNLTVYTSIMRKI